MSCPFYGKCAAPLMKTVVSTGGNQCALVTESFAPCIMETLALKPPNWATCQRNGSPAWSKRAEMITEWQANEEGRTQLFDFKYPD